MAADWRNMSAADLGRGIGAGEIDPMELTAAFLDAIRTHPHRDVIYARLTEHRALAEAEAARDRAKTGHRLGPLDGVPVSWKDLFDTAGVATEAGSALLAGRVPDHDAQVLRNATASGLVCLGKTHMTELAFSGLGVNPVTATPPCINDPQGAPGGSSSGAATSVAFGLAPAGIGSDTGGSVRVPSCWNDLVGLKTTSGRLSLKGVVPLAPKFDTVGPLCRTVEDAALILAALEGGTPADLRGASLKGTRLLVLETVALDGLRNEPRAGFDHALERLAAAGATLVWAEAEEVADAMALSGVLYATEAYATWRDAIEAEPEKMYSEVLKRFRGGAEYSGADYVAAWQMLDACRDRWAARTAGFDAVLVPTCPILPPNVDRLLADADFFLSENLLTLRNTRIGNLMGGAVLTLPTGLASTGISLMGPPMSEERLLRLGRAAEAALA
ncbi:Asp-tRNAAsn/Glu-tRNAGln amidotransferase A subunit and related amidase [Rhodovulum sp. P5]|uniref:amidase n=1 Tax=Rhodovulum sp. P5 TaxID=1564506 RepID=UPI0009C37E0E|nr:amidase family protein [Rhodovulum sp. P5]ARE40505.1 Asp-tRNAAsn/Glu-tRNAGln amidotransferase A subunit and related amidase [Rhodovulum sp. P5]